MDSQQPAPTGPEARPSHPPGTSFRAIWWVGLCCLIVLLPLIVLEVLGFSTLTYYLESFDRYRAGIRTSLERTTYLFKGLAAGFKLKPAVAATSVFDLPRLSCDGSEDSFRWALATTSKEIGKPFWGAISDYRLLFRQRLEGVVTGEYSTVLPDLYLFPLFPPPSKERLLREFPRLLDGFAELNAVERERWKRQGGIMLEPFAPESLSFEVNPRLRLFSYVMAARVNDLGGAVVRHWWGWLLWIGISGPGLFLVGWRLKRHGTILTGGWGTLTRVGSIFGGFLAGAFTLVALPAVAPNLCYEPTAWDHVRFSDEDQKRLVEDCGRFLSEMERDGTLTADDRKRLQELMKNLPEPN